MTKAHRRGSSLGLVTIIEAFMNRTDRSRKSFQSAFLSATVLSTALLGWASSADAETVIRRPGLHPQYSVELEPHLTFDWLKDRRDVSDGIGPGLHVAIPFMHQGPITTINNNMAIKFGFDLTFSGSCYWHELYRERYDCGATSLLLPVALQWNFYITDIITVFGEPGLAIRSTWWDYDYRVNCPAGVCHGDRRDTYPELYMAGGAKFMFGRTIGLTVRLGYPHATIGASFLL
ncbi:MAG TPA: hypothetical protein VKP30_24665 [Polyangiaceae bacterium]|nr:hypothetical protein [Polyangiaceae bacterium]